MMNCPSQQGTGRHWVAEGGTDLSEHIICQEKSILEGSRLPDDVQQSVIRNDDEGVHISSERLDAI